MCIIVRLVLAKATAEGRSREDAIWCYISTRRAGEQGDISVDDIDAGLAERKALETERSVVMVQEEQSWAFVRKAEHGLAINDADGGEGCC